MSLVVIDVAAALAWCFATGPGPGGDALLERVARDGALVPPVWHAELAERLLEAEREARLTAAQVSAIVDGIGRLPIGTDGAAGLRHSGDALHLARRHRLPVRDACYLDLAMRRGLPLATPIAELQRAARESGVELIAL